MIRYKSIGATFLFLSESVILIDLGFGTIDFSLTWAKNSIGQKNNKQTNKKHFCMDKN